MKCIQWQKDSHGLFDYDMRQIDQTSYFTKCPKVVIRHNSDIIFDDIGTNIQIKYTTNHQELFNIYKNRNRFFIEGVVPSDLSQDIDEKYLEAGEPTLNPIEMKERMYNVVRYQNIITSKKKLDYLLKKNDIVKMGRVKIKINQIFIKQKVQDRNDRIKRRKERVQAELEKKLEWILQTENKEFAYILLMPSHDEKIDELRKLFIKDLKYDENYEILSQGSDKSDYEP